MSTTLTNSLRMDQLPPELRAKWEAHKNRQAANHPLYQTSSSDYGKAPRGVQVEFKAPTHAKKGWFSETFAGGGAAAGPRSTLDCTVSKHRFMKDLDPM